MIGQHETPGWLVVGDTDDFEIAIRMSNIVAIRPAPGGGTQVETAAGSVYILEKAESPVELLLAICREERAVRPLHPTHQPKM